MAAFHHGLTILSVSDVVDNQLISKVEENSLGNVDLIISCGDLPPEYLSFLRNRLHGPLFYVKGNHDIRYESAKMLGCENIHGRVVRFKTLMILGLEGSMWYNGGPNQYTDKEMKRQLFRMGVELWWKRPLHMVVTHAPPRHVHDKDDLCHTGFDSFRTLIKKKAPDYLIHGHVHGEFDRFEDRVTTLFKTQVINTCGHAIFEV